MNLHPIFKDCVSKIETRYAIIAPWLQGGYVYATDGQIVVRTPHTPEIGDVPPVDTTPPCAPLFAKHTWPIKLAIGELPPPLAEVKCEECRGRGRVTCDMGHFHECEHCDGEGIIEPPPRPFRVSATQCLSETYARLLVRHGAVLFATERGGDNPFRFTVGGDCKGLVMPMLGGDTEVDVRRGKP